jgi:TorA maturation chaperone TorD
MTNGTSAADPSALAPLARWFGDCLLHELSVEEIAAMATPPLAPALAAVGIAPPHRDQLPELAARWFELFLQPRASLPPVQSLWLEGRYDGAPMVAARALAAAAGLELGGAARAAPPDHLGCLLHLWAELATSAPHLLPQLVAQHLPFAAAALAEARRDGGFYGQLARALTTFLGELRP